MSIPRFNWFNKAPAHAMGGFGTFLQRARWTSALVALTYHARFIALADYQSVEAKSVLTTLFYFASGLGHESFAVFFVIDGIIAARIFLANRTHPRTGTIEILRKSFGMYRLLLPGLVLGAIFDISGANLLNQQGLYTDFPAFSTVTLTGDAFLGNLLMAEPFLAPTFGSNAMLYLFSFLFWTHTFFAAFVAAGLFQGIFCTLLRAGLCVFSLFIMPAGILPWMAIWMLGVAVVLLGHARRARISWHTCASIFAALLVLSRLMGTDDHLLPHPFGRMLVNWKFFIVACGFAILARALYPDWTENPAGKITADGDQIAALGKSHDVPFMFFFHMPVAMLVASFGCELLGVRLMQQPGLRAYSMLLGILLFSYSITLVVSRTLFKKDRAGSGPCQ